MKSHSEWMGLALQLARQAGAEGEVPVGALVVGADGALIAAGANRRERDCDPTAHAEVVAMRLAGQKLGAWRLTGCTLYVTLEPCAMCTGALLQARVERLVYGADDPKAGAIASVYNLPESPGSFHRLEVIAGIEEAACCQLLTDWFAQRRTR
ncbi:tRNA adenosine(34) deaminase TadA [Gloeobacter kilaueensis]|uniref:tRNA-specific adenosine deaminase n=1 Tax=Gloeobacter kilaueensis (strain ATCC BAA-2537 / CCAP 1431/1 / ULC 316 / JS1) TaxID=1183438 RepID=U5QN95_GLOK1|nr:tRNA adenosine(34) deaminase TadA [Gloeobacter kilaueensis]AGY59155.1 tRNA-specific adenosine deaminase [Gloeobacter kilaueensis JS1]